VQEDVNDEACHDNNSVEDVKVGGEISPAKRPNTQDQFKHEKATKHQARDPQGVSHSIPDGTRVAFFAGIQVDEDVSENPEEVKRDKAEDAVVLGSRGEEVLEQLEVVRVLRLEGAGVVGVCFGGVCGLAVVGAWVNGVVDGAGGEKRLLGAVVVGGHLGMYGGLVLICRMKWRP